MHHEVFAAPEELARARVPHELFLINLIGNHILLFVAILSASSLFHYIALVPLISAAILAYSLWRSRRSLSVDTWYVQCHWQVARRRSLVFIVMLAIMGVVSAAGWIGFTYFGMMKEAVLAIIGGVGVLPTMVTVLILIIMESDSLHQARHGQLPGWVVERLPNPEVQPAVK